MTRGGAVLCPPVGGAAVQRVGGPGTLHMETCQPHTDARISSVRASVVHVSAHVGCAHTHDTRPHSGRRVAPRWLSQPCRQHTRSAPQTPVRAAPSGPRPDAGTLCLGSTRQTSSRWLGPCSADLCPRPPVRAPRCPHRASFSTGPRASRPRGQRATTLWGSCEMPSSGEG